MRKKYIYETPEMEIVHFDTEDIITASGLIDSDFEGDNEEKLP